MVIADWLWVSLAIVCFLSAISFLSLSVYLALFKNPAMDRFIHNDERYAEAISEGGIPLGVMRAGEYGIYFIICRIFDKPIKKFFKNAKQEKNNESTILYELNVAFSFIFLISSVAVYLTQPESLVH